MVHSEQEHQRLARRRLLQTQQQRVVAWPATRRNLNTSSVSMGAAPAAASAPGAAMGAEAAAAAVSVSMAAPPSASCSVQQEMVSHVDCNGQNLHGAAAAGCSQPTLMYR